MYTVEFDHDDIEITIIDDAGFYEDLKIDAFDNIVYIRQWNNEIERFNSIAISSQMWEELIAAISSSEGSFVVRR
jgi:hypothetical protein